jgi:hypothetical protein
MTRPAVPIGSANCFFDVGWCGWRADGFSRLDKGEWVPKEDEGTGTVSITQVAVYWQGRFW